MTTTSVEERAAICDAVRGLMRDKSSESAVRATMETPQGYDAALWSQLVELGITGLLIDPEYGGSGLGPVELELVMEETGAALLCSPLLSSCVLSAGLLSASGDRDAQARILPGIADGTRIATVALTGDAGTWTQDGVAVEAAGDDGAATLSGVASYVTHGQIADVLLIVARSGADIGIFEVAADAAGLTKQALPSFDKTLRLARLEFADTPARRIGGAGWPAVRSALDLALVALAGEQAGGARRMLRHDGRIRQNPHPVRPPDRQLPGASSTWPPTCCSKSNRHISAARHAARDLAEGRPGRDAADQPRRLRLRRRLSQGRRHGDPDARRHRLHLGAPAHLYLRRARADAQLLGFAGASIANAISPSSEPDRWPTSRTSIRPTPRCAPRCAPGWPRTGRLPAGRSGQVEPVRRHQGMGREGSRRGLGRADMAERLVWPRTLRRNRPT